MNRRIISIALSILLVVVMSFSLSACGSKDAPDTGSAEYDSVTFNGYVFQVPKGSPTQEAGEYLMSFNSEDEPFPCFRYGVVQDTGITLDKIFEDVAATNAGSPDMANYKVIASPKSADISGGEAKYQDAYYENEGNGYYTRQYMMKKDGVIFEVLSCEPNEVSEAANAIIINALETVAPAGTTESTETATAAKGSMASDEDLSSISVLALGKNGTSSKAENNVIFADGNDGQAGIAYFPDDYKVEVLQSAPTSLKLIYKDNEYAVSNVSFISASSDIAVSSLQDSYTGAKSIKLEGDNYIVRVPDDNDYLIMSSGKRTVEFLISKYFVELYAIDEVQLISDMIKSVQL